MEVKSRNKVAPTCFKKKKNFAVIILTISLRDRKDTPPDLCRL